MECGKWEDVEWSVGDGMWSVWSGVWEMGGCGVECGRWEGVEWSVGVGRVWSSVGNGSVWSGVECGRWVSVEWSGMWEMGECGVEYER